MSKIESCQINFKDTLSDSDFCADSEIVLSFSKKVFRELENRSIPAKMVGELVKPTFLNAGKKRENSAL